MGLERIGAHDHSFAVGGHTLLAARLVSQVRETLRVDLPLTRLFAHRTVLGLAQALVAYEAQPGQTEKLARLLQRSEGIDTAAEETGKGDSVMNINSREKRGLLEYLLKEEGIDSPQPQTIPRRTNPGELPLSFAQQGLWLFHQLVPESAAYNEPTAVRLQGVLQVAALEQSINEIIRRHAVLRTTFTAVDGRPAQRIHDMLRLPLPAVDLPGLSENEQEAHVHRLALEEFQQPFDLTQGPLLRVKLFRLGEEDHVFLLTMHHAISDGWSVGVFFQELAMLYAAFASGNPSPLPELAWQYADFAHWQRQHFHGEKLAAHLAYWKQQLGGPLPSLELPTDCPRPLIQTFRGARQYLSIPLALTTALKALSQYEGVTLFMTLLAAFQTLLHRYTGQDDLLVGTPIAGRNWPEVEGLIGCFLNTLVLRTDLAGNPSFRDLLGRVREVALGAYAHQDLPFEHLVEALQPERDLSRNPLFQVMFILQNALHLALPGLSARPMEPDRGASPFDVILSLEETEQGLRGWWEYNTDLFDHTTITRLSGHFQTLLKGIVAGPTQRLSALPLLPADEWQQLLVTWNATQTAYPQEACLPALFEAQVACTPAAVAVSYEEQRLTYAELNQQANQLAHYLRTQGVGPEVLVGLCVERSLAMLVGVWGILKAGGAYVPLDPTYPQERLAFMLADAQIRLCVTQARLRPGLAELVETVVTLDSDWDTIALEGDENPTQQVSAENLAYVIYTSGSTGRPKGVQIPHRAVVNCLWAMRQQPGIAAQDRVLAVTTLAFDIAVVELLFPLMVGAHVVLASRSIAADGEALGVLLARIRPTLMQATPATWRMLLDAGWQGDPQLRILCGGEALPPELAAQLCACSAAVWNLYGPTETTIWSTVTKVEAGECVVPIGRPIANTEIYLLDTVLQPVPIGVPGELYIGGAGLARGYLRRPELTHEKFIVHPFRTAPGERLYRTGDLARYGADGTLKFLGRADHQVKIRGFRIELGEIEAVLAQQPAVREAMVLAREDTPGDKRLVAYVVPHQQPPKSHELRHALLQQLPDYMVPSAFVYLDALPLTPNGKRDRLALPVPEHNRETLGTTLVPPCDVVELQLTMIWEEVLGRRPIGVRDDFFALGGHSFLAARLFAEITKHMGRKLPLVTLFQAPTIAHLASLLRQDGWVAPWASLVPIQPGGSQPPFFCLHAAGGNVLSYLDLARHLGEDQPFYGVQAQGLDGNQPLLTQVEEMAARYVAEIRTLQPEGPYFLGGLCFGGLVAFEMAQQLQRQGQQVAQLVLLDTFVPGSLRFLPTESRVRYRIDELLRRARHHQENLRLLAPRQRLHYLAEKARGVVRRQAQTVVGSSRQRAHWGGMRHRTVLPATLTQLETMNFAAARRYVPSVYQGSLTLFRARKQPPGVVPNPYLGWEGLASQGIAIYEVPGDHLSMLREPLVEQLANHLRQCLRQAQQLTITDKHQ